MIKCDEGYSSLNLKNMYSKSDIISQSTSFENNQKLMNLKMNRREMFQNENTLCVGLKLIPNVQFLEI